MRRCVQWSVLFIVMGLLSPPLAAHGASTVLDLRYRLESVDQDGIERDATASTARLRLGVEAPIAAGFEAGVMFHGTRVIGEASYNDTANGRIDRPVIADPEDEGISQVWAGWRTPEDALVVRLGRQRLIDDNARFIGNVGFRQLEQTFDAATLRWRPAVQWQAELFYLDRARRVFGANNPNPLLAAAELDTWAGIVTHQRAHVGISVYAHRLEFEDRPGSHKNIGLRAIGTVPGWQALSWRVELAAQSGAAGSGPDSDQHYLHLRFGGSHGRWSWHAGHERLSGDGIDAFQTPFATLHAHNGWVDRFLVTPAAGLRDSYAGAGATLAGWRLLTRLHDFRADSKGARFGHEIDFSAARTLWGPWQFELKLAHLDGASGQADTTKAWLTLSADWRLTGG